LEREEQMLDTAGTGVAWWPLAAGLLGGLALFLLGLEQLTRSLRAVTGDSLRWLLARMSRTPVRAAASGAASTAVVQSSSVTTVLVIGFVSAGMMTLPQAAGVIIGANLGSTFTAQLIAFHVSGFALGMVAIGFAARASRRPSWLREGGAVLLGMGLVFYGMTVMGEAVTPLRDLPAVTEVLTSRQSLVGALLAGLVFTALVQSSAATIGLVIVLASQGLLTLPAAIAVTLGANVGTCVTAGLAAIGRSRPAVRAALVHVLVNVVGVLLWVGFVDSLADFVVWLSPTSPHLEGMARLAADTPRQVANAHTTFNLVNTLLFIGFTRPLARLAERLVPAREGDADEQRDPRYLDEDVLDTPSVALALARLETVRLAFRVKVMVDAIGPATLTGTRRQLRAVAELDHDVDRLHRLILAYLAKIGRGDLTTEQSNQMLRLLSIANILEQIGDVVETNLVALGLHRIDEGIRPSPSTHRVVMRFHGAVRDQFAAVVEALDSEDSSLARQVRRAKRDVVALRDAATAHQAGRLLDAGPRRVRAYTRESEIVEHLRRIYTLTRGISRLVLEEPQADATGREAPDPDRGRTAAQDPLPLKTGRSP
jgi:phosphate:Na+ symporter